MRCEIWTLKTLLLKVWCAFSFAISITPPKFNTNQKFLTEIDKLSQNKPQKGRKYTKSDQSEKGISVLLIF